MVRFPHSAVIRWTPATYNESAASFTEGTEQSITVEGRAMSLVYVGSLIKTADGNEVKASYKFISRRLVKKVPFGANIEITFPDFTHKATVLRHENYQVFSEIWL